jgi:group I intron endonuclease
MYGVIYEAINTVNGKRYIGQTTKTMDQRRKCHIYDAINHLDFSPFHKALNKYGVDIFVWKEIDYANNRKELNDKEKFWIKFFDTYIGHGYNATPGGSNRPIRNKNSITYNYNNKPFMVFDKDGNYIQTTLNKVKFAQNNKINRDLVTSVLQGRKNSVGDYILFYEDEFTPEKLKHHMRQLRNHNEFTIYDVKSKEYLGVWNNFTKCSEDTGITRRAMEKQRIKGIKTKPRKFVVKYLSDCDEYEINEIYNKIKYVS